MITLRQITLLALLALANLAVASPGEDSARTTVFRSISESEREVVLGNLQHLLESSIDEALEQIRRQGGIRPFAYIGDYEGGGRFIRLSSEQQIPPDVAAHAIQKTVVQGALEGTLIASLLYITTDSSPSLTEELLSRFQEQLTAEGRDIAHVRYLLIEMQHLAGLGLLHVVPYWQENGEWRVGNAVQQVIEPRLHDLVKSTLGIGTASQNPGKEL
ncbi:hypothetical protein [Marinobacter sp. SS21]|uniref:hypothetical protein n=1 Tax=Marinobacter sp. SS21 TaxID=2979460 RepID=UPI00232C3567|nr:hypothetical protein [Marinobacter sp. SS21]MDC0661519.1 hypothetical protein [Marinobacter sp. SS21]